MKGLLESLKETLQLLDKYSFQYALAGGLAASLYRQDIRATQDIDFIIWTEGNVIDDSKTILEALNLKPHEVRLAELQRGPLQAIKNKSTPICIVCGRSEAEGQIRVDFLLHTLPWVSEALERSQSNIQIFDGRKVPCITVEDLILAKLSAFEHKSTRFKDLDDLQSILENKKLNIDWSYTATKIKELGLSLPDQIKELFPDVVQKITKRKKT